MDRDITKVIDDILKVIPEDETILRGCLESRKKSAMYTAPEAMFVRWSEVAAILNGIRSDQSWTFAVERIFSGKAG